jgi:hypothetical protein
VSDLIPPVAPTRLRALVIADSPYVILPIFDRHNVIFGANQKAIPGTAPLLLDREQPLCYW